MSFRVASWVAASLVGLASLGTLLATLFSAPACPRTAGTQSCWLEGLHTLALLSYIGISVAVSFTVLQYRSYDIDLSTSWTLTQP